MLKDELRSISPLDGRYSKRLQALEEKFSEYALIKSRLKVEIEWLIFLSNQKSISFVKPLSKKNVLTLRNLIEDFSLKDAKEIKKIESSSNHDVKAVEIYIVKKLASIKLHHYNEFVHLFCTSEDINNLSYSLMLSLIHI